MLNRRTTAPTGCSIKEIIIYPAQGYHEGEIKSLYMDKNWPGKGCDLIVEKEKNSIMVLCGLGLRS